MVAAAFYPGVSRGAPVVDGPTHAGKQVLIDLPVSLRLKNIAGTDGAGQCVFTSITHAGRYENVRSLFDFQEKMRRERGGGWPEKVDQMLKKYAPDVQYIQYEGADLAIVELAMKTGRPVCCCWNGHDPHYRGTIAHMVNLVYLDADTACILDNNFIGDNELVWCSRQEFVQRAGGRQMWFVILLAPPPVPTPPMKAPRELVERRRPKDDPQPTPAPTPIIAPDRSHPSKSPTISLATASVCISATGLVVMVLAFLMRPHP